MPAIDVDRIVQDTVDLCAIPSPTGYTALAQTWVADQLRAMGVPVVETAKGSLVATLPGGEGEGRMLSAHVDTLGAVVKEILPSGRLRMSMVGGYDWSTVEGEYCLVHPRDGDPVSGTVVTDKASYHVHGDALKKLIRSAESMEIRLDAAVSTSGNVRELGIEVGDPVSYDPRTTITPSGHIKSRHLDDKACAAIQLAVARSVIAGDTVLARPAHLYFSCWEEVGHGTSSSIPPGVTEIVAVDMAAVGHGQTSDERAVTICAKDSSGPYHHGLTTRLIELAKAEALDYRVDTYPYYGSDVSQALRAGHEVRGALVGPGVDASHSFERLHRDALEQTTRLLLAYLAS